MTDSTDNALSDPRVTALVGAARRLLNAAKHCGEPIPNVPETFAHEDSIFSGNLRAALGLSAALAALEGGKTDD